MIPNWIINWCHWFSSLHLDELFAVVGGLFLLDGPRYALGTVLMCFWDWGRLLFGLDTEYETKAYTYCPSVSVVIVGHNEAETIGATLGTIWGTYPRLEIIVVDDGSTDGMADKARDFANDHTGVRVLTCTRRSGKAAALNTALHYSNSEVIVPVDADSELGEHAIWEIVQPLENPKVGAVAGAILARNAFCTFATWIQAYEYLHAIFMGRMLNARLSILGIVSGAFGAFRGDELRRIMGWDVGHGEDGDLTLRLRKSGYRVAFAPYAQCFTNVPLSFRKLFKQRRRWNRGVIRHKSRKHIDMAYFWSPSFRWTNFFHLLDAWVFRILCLLAIWVHLVVITWDTPNNLPQIIALLYLCYVGFQVVQTLPIMYYSNARSRDAFILLALPFAPAYQFFLRLARTVSILEEVFFRMSYRDNFYPAHIRHATWHW